MSRLAKLWRLVLVGACLLAGGLAWRSVAQDPELLGNRLRFLASRWVQPATVASRVADLDAEAKAFWAAALKAQGWSEVPAQLALLGFKDRRVLEVYARQASDQVWVHLHSFPVLGQSGGPGPKRRAGDLQVPEGIYHVEALNPNSRFRLALRVSYPNARDRAEAAAQVDLGSDIMIHGSRTSIGCLALGNAAIDVLFWLVARSEQPTQTPVLLAPTDWRRETGTMALDARNVELVEALRVFPLPAVGEPKS